ncbi:uncharacterized protein BDV17DRAFT_262501 [Aspergillus undulatus]|uniref:uncharacterized protein n=1 Tax=Aspergillus undulatus TaxID=1810928 RepID=UPI003CCD8DBA
MGCALLNLLRLNPPTTCEWIACSLASYEWPGYRSCLPAPWSLPGLGCSRVAVNCLLS